MCVWGGLTVARQRKHNKVGACKKGVHNYEEAHVCGKRRGEPYTTTEVQTGVHPTAHPPTPNNYWHLLAKHRRAALELVVAKVQVPAKTDKQESEQQDGNLTTRTATQPHECRTRFAFTVSLQGNKTRWQLTRHRTPAAHTHRRCTSKARELGSAPERLLWLRSKPLDGGGAENTTRR